MFDLQRLKAQSSRTEEALLHLRRASWRLACLLVQVASIPTAAVDTRTSILHKIVACGSEPVGNLVELACDIVPDAILQQDSRGMTPLHLANESEAIDVGSRLLERQPLAASISNEDGETNLMISVRLFSSFNALTLGLLRADDSPPEIVYVANNVLPFLLERLKDDLDVVSDC